MSQSSVCDILLAVNELGIAKILIGSAKKINRSRREFVDNCLEFMSITISGNTV